MKTETNYLLGIVRAIDSEGDERLKNSKEYHEIICDVPGIIIGAHCFPKSGEIDEPRIGDQVLLLDLDPLYHSYMIYEKLKEDDFIGFRASGNVMSITPEGMTIGTYNIDDAGQESWESKDEPESLNASISLEKSSDDNDNIELKAAGVIKLDAYNGGQANSPCIIANGGSNGGLVNINFLKQIISAINSDLAVAGSGANLGAIIGMMDQLEDKTFKH